LVILFNGSFWKTGNAFHSPASFWDCFLVTFYLWGLEIVLILCVSTSYLLRKKEKEKEKEDCFPTLGPMTRNHA
jgi:hypothetical protein